MTVAMDRYLPCVPGFLLFHSVLKHTCQVGITDDEESDGRKCKGLAQSHTESQLQRRDLMAVVWFHVLHHCAT